MLRISEDFFQSLTPAHRPTSGKSISTRTGFRRTHSTASSVMSSTAWWDMERPFREATAASARATESGGIGRPERTTLRYWSSSAPKERSQLMPPLS